MLTGIPLEDRDVKLTWREHGERFISDAKEETPWRGAAAWSRYRNRVAGPDLGLLVSGVSLITKSTTRFI